MTIRQGPTWQVSQGPRAEARSAHEPLHFASGAAWRRYGEVRSRGGAKHANEVQSTPVPSLRKGCARRAVRLRDLGGPRGLGTGQVPHFLLTPNPQSPGEEIEAQVGDATCSGSRHILPFVDLN